jgi:hypothetical protein
MFEAHSFSRRFLDPCYDKAHEKEKSPYLSPLFLLTLLQGIHVGGANMGM